MFQKLDTHTSKEDMGIPETLPTFFTRNSPQIIIFSVTGVKKAQEFRQNLIVFGFKKWDSQFLF